MLAEIRTGPIVAADGAVSPGRADRTGALVAVDGHGRYQEAVLRGAVFNACTSAAQALSSGLVTSNVGLTLTNPASSGKNLVLLETIVMPTTTASAAATIVWAANTNPVAAAVTHTTSIPVRSALLGGGVAAVGLVDTAATLPAGPTPVRVIGGMPAGNSQPLSAIKDETAGALVLTPGTAISISSIGIGISAIMSVTWEEVSV